MGRLNRYIPTYLFLSGPTYLNLSLHIILGKDTRQQTIV
jgi:hypothetical protein